MLMPNFDFFRDYVYLLSLRGVIYLTWNWTPRRHVLYVQYTRECQIQYTVYRIFGKIKTAFENNLISLSGAQIDGK